MITPSEVRALVLQPYKVEKLDGQQVDCFALVHWVYKQSGIELPLSYIPFLQAFRPFVGAPRFLDVIVMSLHQPWCDHVGVVLDEQHFIHARPGQRVTVDRIQHELWQRITKGIVRYKAWI